MAIATKEVCNQGNKTCYLNMDEGYYRNKVCNDGQQFNDVEFAKQYCGSESGVPCFNNYTLGRYNQIDQCYNSIFIGYVWQTTGLN